MKSTMVEFTEAFEVKLGDARSQAAVMVIAPGQAEGGLDNRHRGADQWLLCRLGERRGDRGSTCALLEPGTLMLIERGEAPRDSKHRGRTPCHAQLFRAAGLR